MSLMLNDLTKFSDIVIQCHDNPDADALASAYALQWYFAQKGIEARIIYGGAQEISKCNLVLMTMCLGIDAKHVKKKLPKTPELLVTVDCQYGEGNVTHFNAKNVAVIDHHQVRRVLPELSEVRSNYGSCSTLLYELLKAEGYDINVHPENPDSKEPTRLATVLYYGLMTDTDGFATINHPADKDLRDYANYSEAEYNLLRNSNISEEELGIAADALKTVYYSGDGNYAVINAKPCDPNLLGLISDMLLEVNNLNTCLVYCIFDDYVKYSVRSCVKEVRANELAGFLSEGVGGGGGHLVKAGGRMEKDLLAQKKCSYNKKSIFRYLTERLDNYFAETTVIYAGDYLEDVSVMKKYRKKDVEVGYVLSSKIAANGERLQVRTLEGDVDITVSNDIYILFGVEGEPYPVKVDKFKKSYKLSRKEYQYQGKANPSFLNYSNSKILDVKGRIKTCIAKGGQGIYARQLTSRVKIFPKWDQNHYYLGTPGDYLAVRADDPYDLYIIAKDIFPQTYEEI